MRRILIVDDDDHVAQGLCWVLNLRGFQAETCGSAEHALEMIGANPHDLVISDLRLPGMSGQQLFEHLAVMNPATHRILITGFGTAELEAWATNQVDAYLTKPFSAQQLVQSVQRVFALKPGELTNQEDGDEIA